MGIPRHRQDIVTPAAKPVGNGCLDRCQQALPHFIEAIGRFDKAVLGESKPAAGRVGNQRAETIALIVQRHADPNDLLGPCPVRLLPQRTCGSSIQHLGQPL